VGPVHRFLARRRGHPSSPVRDPDCSAGAAVSLVGPAGDVGLCEGVDDAVLAGGSCRASAFVAEPASCGLCRVKESDRSW
jgi:hypothetical protein